MKTPIRVFHNAPRPITKDVTDATILDALVKSDQLTSQERDAFEGMRDRLTSTRALSSAQRGWAEDRYRAYQLDADQPSENLASSGKVKITDEERAKVYPWEKMARPLKPPNRK